MRKYIIFGILLVFCTSCSKNLESGKFVPSTSEEEMQALEIFYDIDEKTISRGKKFDLKFTYFDKYDVGNSILEIVKKTDEDLGDIIISTQKRNGDRLFSMNYGNFDETIFNFYPQDRKYLKFIQGTDFLDEHERTEKYILNDEDFENYTEILVIIEYNGVEEKHKLKYSPSIFNELEKIKLYETNDSIDYQNEILSYYYGLLFEQNFSMFSIEMQKLLNDPNCEKMKMDLIFHIPPDTKYHDLKSLFKMNDAEFEEYKKLLEQALNKGYINERQKHIKSLIN